jgi:hypothetical protein
MAKGTGTYDDPIICDGLFSKTIDGVKKFFKIKTGASVDTSNFVKKSGDTLNGNYFFSDKCNLYKTNKTSTLKLNASNDGKDGARLVLCGKDTKDFPAEFNLCANDGISDVQLIGKANGKLYWNNNEIERVNSVGSNYIRYESGLQIEWGKYVTSSKKETVNFPMPFKDPPIMSVTLDGNVDNDSAVNFIGYAHPTVANFISFTNWGSGMVCMYIAIGKWK